MLTFRDDEVKAAIQADTGLRPPFALEAFPDPAQDVRQSIRRITASPFVPHKDSVRGFVYEVATGKLREVTCLALILRHGTWPPCLSYI
jgi:carbonic anhydrase